MTPSYLPKNEASISNTENIAFVGILSTNNPAEVVVIKSILEAEDIPYYIIGEQMMTSPLLTGGGSARLFISPNDLDYVKDLFKDFEFEEPDLLIGILRKF